jgi:regulatory protein
MRTITTIEVEKRRKDRVKILLDGAFAFSLGAEVAAEQGLHVGQALSDPQIEELGKANLLQRCLNAALRFLSYRPRSEAEIRMRLRQGFDQKTIDRVILQLEARRMIDDVAFAKFWIENRESFSPRSERMLKLELKRKGIAVEVIDEVLDGSDEDGAAYRAAQKKARFLSQEDYDVFRRKLGAFLRRRGFSYEVANHAVERLWRDATG